MNYYERHLGDYARDTAHLSLLEHGVYTLLLDRYYATEAPIPADQAVRVARARTKDEKAAVEAVLAEFFVLVDGAWTSRRCDEEIEKARGRIDAARSNGKKGGRPKKNPAGSEKKPSGFLLGSENETQQKAHHTPHTKHQTPDTSTPSESTSPSETTKVSDTHRASACVLPPATNAGIACRAMRRGGLADTNPAHPKLLALLDAGATEAQCEHAASSAAGKGKGFAYALGILEGQLADAAKPTRRNGSAVQNHNAQVAAAWLADFAGDDA